jgi:hypothetical protein
MMDNVNPYSTEVRYSLDLMGQLLQAQKPHSVRIYSDSAEMVKAVVRRVAFDDYRLFVNTPALREAVQASLGLEVDIAVAGAEPAEAALFPLSPPGASLPRERILVAAVRNALSYKSLLYPGTVRTTAFGTLARVRRHYQIEQVVGMYPPRFIALLARAHLARRRSASEYFRLSDRAMQYLYEFGPMWRLSYVVIFAGHR